MDPFSGFPSMSPVGLYWTSLSGPEVQQIFKVGTHQKSDVLLPGGRTFITWNNGEKIQKKNPNKILKIFFQFFSFFGLDFFDTKFVFKNLTCEYEK